MIIATPRAQQATIAPVPRQRIPDPGALQWSDEFNDASGVGPDPGNWFIQTLRYNSANGELQYYTTSTANCYHDGSGNLVIKAIQENPPDNKPAPKNFTSARIVTRLIREFTPPFRVAARIKVPNTKGILPAFWMQGSDPDRPESWPHQGEIDIMEFPVGNIRNPPSLGNLIPTTIHGPTLGSGGGGFPEHAIGINNFFTYDVSEDFHIFGLDWYTDKFVFHMDGDVQAIITQAQYAATGGDWNSLNGSQWPYYILLNVAVGGSYSHNPDSTSVFPQSMLVDYVRVWDLNDETGTGPSLGYGSGAYGSGIYPGSTSTLFGSGLFGSGVYAH